MAGSINEMISKFKNPTLADTPPTPVKNSEIKPVIKPKMAKKLLRKTNSPPLQYNQTFRRIDTFLSQKVKHNGKTTTVLTDAQYSAQYHMDAEQQRIVETIIYSLLRFSASFEKTWKLHGKAKWHYLMYAVSTSFLHELNTQILLAQKTRPFPIVNLNDKGTV